MRFLKFFGLFVICLFFVSCGLHQDSTTEKQRHFDSSSKQNSLEKSKWKGSFWVEADKDTKSGYPYMNNDRSGRTICKDGNYLYAAENNGSGSTLYRYKGKDKEIIYKSKFGQIYFLNAKNGCIVFELIEKKGRNREIDNYTIIRLNCNGASVDVKQIDGIVNDLWLYDNRIYYSLFTKMGGKNIESMDLNGEDVKVLVKKENGVYFYVSNEKIYVVYENEDNECELYQMDLDGSNQQLILKFAAYADSVCLYKDAVYFRKPGDEVGEEEYLYQFCYGEKKEKLLIDDAVAKCFFSGESIYFQSNYGDWVKKINLSNGNKSIISNKGIAKWGCFDIVLGRKIFWGCENGKLIYVDSNTGKDLS